MNHGEIKKLYGKRISRTAGVCVKDWNNLPDGMQMPAGYLCILVIYTVNYARICAKDLCLGY